MKFKKKIISETTWSIGTKICLDSPWIIPVQNYVRQSRLPTNMATVAKNRKRGVKLKKKSSETTGSIGSKLC
jgi:hypothetical protein